MKPKFIGLAALAALVAATVTGAAGATNAPTYVQPAPIPAPYPTYTPSTPGPTDLSGTFPDLVNDAGLFMSAPQCVTPQRMASLGGPDAQGTETLGLTVFGQYGLSPTVYLINDVCRGLRAFEKTVDYSNSGSYGTPPPISRWDVESVKVLFHEAAHTRGVRSEQRAECAGVRGALHEIALYAPDIYAQARHILVFTDERYRPPAYKLRGACTTALTARGAGASSSAPAYTPPPAYTPTPMPPVTPPAPSPMPNPAPLPPLTASCPRGYKATSGVCEAPCPAGTHSAGFGLCQAPCPTGDVQSGGDICVPRAWTTRPQLTYTPSLIAQPNTEFARR